MKRLSAFRLIRKRWMLMIAVIVVAISGALVYRLHGIFGSQDANETNRGISSAIVPFNPKQVILEVFGTPGDTATINYLDVNAQPQMVKDAVLPWSVTITSTEPSVLGNVVAQGNGATLGCRIIVNGAVKDERVVHTAQAYTFCLDKSG